MLNSMLREEGFFKKARIEYPSQGHALSLSALPPGGQQTAAERLTGHSLATRPTWAAVRDEP